MSNNFHVQSQIMIENRHGQFMIEHRSYFHQY